MDAESIFKNLIEMLAYFRLDINKIASFASDNANTVSSTINEVVGKLN
jgi:hypothetical protein